MKEDEKWNELSPKMREISKGHQYNDNARFRDKVYQYHVDEDPLDEKNVKNVVRVLNMDRNFRELMQNKQQLKDSMGYLFKHYSPVSKALFLDKDQITMDEICQKV